VVPLTPVHREIPQLEKRNYLAWHCSGLWVYGRTGSAARAWFGSEDQRRGRRPVTQDQKRAVYSAAASGVSVRASWVREVTPSFWYTLRRWYSTVAGLMKS
jgi:hypothetical protein